MGKDLPNDAVGATNAITGTILAYPDGRIVKDSSKIVIDVRTLKSDQSRRDGFLQRIAILVGHQEGPGHGGISSPRRTEVDR